VRFNPRPALLIALLIALTACQPVPRVFERNADEDNGLLRLTDSLGIIVEPVVAAPPATAQGLAREMVAALIDRNVPAYMGSRNQSSMVLAGRVVDRGREAHIVWVLRDRNGAVIGEYDQSIEGTPIAPWADGDATLMAAFAERAATRIAGFIQEDGKGEIVMPAIHVGEVNGAPQGGTTHLQAALRQSLRRMGARVAKKPGKEALTASANVHLTPLDGDRVEVAIGWIVADPFGFEIGRIEQASPFARRVVEERWGELAREAGLAAAAGMVDLVSRIDWREGFLRPDRDDEVLEPVETIPSVQITSRNDSAGLSPVELYLQP